MGEALWLPDGERITGLLAQLREAMKILAIDTPPFTAGVDALPVGNHADGVLVVVRSGRTDPGQARTKLASYAQVVSLLLIGAVLNDVPVGRSVSILRLRVRGLPERAESSLTGRLDPRSDSKSSLLRRSATRT